MSWMCGATARRLRRATASWRRWASRISTPALMLALRSRFMLRYWLCFGRTSTSNQGRDRIVLWQLAAKRPLWSEPRSPCNLAARRQPARWYQDGLQHTEYAYVEASALSIDVMVGGAVLR